MKTLKGVRGTLERRSSYIKEIFGVKEIGIFGSYVRQEQEENSDIDILVEFKDGYRTFDNYMDLKFYLEELLGIRVDLVSKDALKPRLRSYILEEIVYV
jgi:predicted nucleotidyltransferase